MTRKALLLATLALSLHCSKGSSGKAPPAQAAPPAAKEAAAETPPPAEPEPAAEEPKLEITEGRVTRYVAYMTDWIPAQRAIQQQYGTDFARIDKEKGLKQTGDALGSIQKAQKAADEAERTSLAKAGLSKEEVAAVGPAVGEVITARLIYGQQEGGMKAMVKQMQDAVAKLPADQRADAEKQVAEMTKGLDDLKTAKEARQKYGDPAVDAILKHEVELTALWKQSMGAK